MDPFDRVRQWAAMAFGVPAASLTRETTLGELMARRAPELPAREDIGGAAHPFDISTDSLDRIELIMMIEEGLDLEIRDADVGEGECLLPDPRTTLGELTAMLDRGEGGR